MHELFRWSNGTFYINGWLLFGLLAIVAFVIVTAIVIGRRDDRSEAERYAAFLRAFIAEQDQKSGEFRQDTEQ